MTNTFMTGLKNATNYTYTANGALAHKSTGDEVYDLFALGGAYVFEESFNASNMALTDGASFVNFLIVSSSALLLARRN